MSARDSDPAAVGDAEKGTDAESPGASLGELDSLLQAPVSQRQPADPAPQASGVTEAPQVIEADIDGRRVRIVARDEIVLECGEASITLRRNGRIIIKGTYIETCSEGTNRIKGGQVRIN